MADTPEKRFRTVPLVPRPETLRGQVAQGYAEIAQSIEKFLADEWPTIYEHLKPDDRYTDATKERYFFHADAFRREAYTYRDRARNAEAELSDADRAELEVQLMIVREAKRDVHNGMEKLRKLSYH